MSKLEIKQGGIYRHEPDGHIRTVLRIDQDMVVYRIDGILSFFPLRMTLADFQKWAQFELYM